MAGSFDAVVTCFFIDTAHNVIEYLEVISKVLRPGGLWINLGPLLWHWADSGPDEMSLELPLSEIHRLAQLMGFVPLRQEFVDAAYIGGLVQGLGPVAWVAAGAAGARGSRWTRAHQGWMLTRQQRGHGAQHAGVIARSA